MGIMVWGNVDFENRMILQLTIQMIMITTRGYRHLMIMMIQTQSYLLNVIQMINALLLLDLSNPPDNSLECLLVSALHHLMCHPLISVRAVSDAAKSDVYLEDVMV